MNTLPAHDVDLEERLRTYYRQDRSAPTESETLWARLAPLLDERTHTFPQAEDLMVNVSATPLPTAAVPPGSQRHFFTGVSALAAALVVVLLAVTTFTFFRHMPRGTIGPLISLDRSKIALQSVSMVSASEGWAVGTTNAHPAQGVILQYTRGRWTPESLPDFKHSAVCTSLGKFPCGISLSSISMVSAHEGWAVGSTVPPTSLVDVGSRAILLHYVGGHWMMVNIAAAYLTSLFMRATNDGWMVGQALGPDGGGQSEVLHYDGYAWTVLHNPVLASVSESLIAGAPNGNVWVCGIDYSVPVGDGFDGNSPTVLLHFDGNHWSKVDPHIVNGRLYSMAFVLPEEGWAVGTLPNTNQHPPSKADGLILQYQNGAWQAQTRVSGPFGQPYFALTSLAMVSASEGWAVGDQGTILHYHDGVWRLYQGS